MVEPILLNLPDELTTERMTIRPYRAGDGAGLFAAVDESREHILPWMPWGPVHQTPDDSEKLVRTWTSKWTLREDMPLGMFDQISGEFLGGMGLHRIDWSIRSFEIGYWIRKSATGKGYVTEAVKRVTEFAFEELQANRVFIRCAAGNLRSIAIAKRAGFIYEGSLRNSIKDANGELHDVLHFSLIPEDWAALKG